MLPKKNRAGTRSVKEIFEKGERINSPTLSFRFIMGKEGEEPKISFIVPKSIAAKATKRNTLRRRGYNALKNHIHQFPKGTIGVFLYKKTEEPPEKIESEIKLILNALKK